MLRYYLKISHGCILHHLLITISTHSSLHRPVIVNDTAMLKLTNKMQKMIQNCKSTAL